MKKYRAALTSVGIKIMTVIAVVFFTACSAVFGATGITPVAVPVVTGILAAVFLFFAVVFFCNSVSIDPERRELVVRELKTRRIPLMRVRSVEADTAGTLSKRRQRYIHLVVRTQSVEKIVISGYTSLSSKTDKERTEEIAREISEILRRSHH